MFATLVVAGAAGLGTLASRFGALVLISAVPLLFAVLPWGAAVLGVLLRVMRPALHSGAFTDAEDRGRESSTWR